MKSTLKTELNAMGKNIHLLYRIYKSYYYYYVLESGEKKKKNSIQIVK